jgi:hypothetical protein
VCLQEKKSRAAVQSNDARGRTSGVHEFLTIRSFSSSESVIVGVCRVHRLQRVRGVGSRQVT